MDDNKQISSDVVQNTHSQVPSQNTRSFVNKRIIVISVVIFVILINISAEYILVSKSIQQDKYLQESSKKASVTAPIQLNTPPVDNKTTTADFSSIEIAVKAPVQILVTDPDRYKTGFDTSSSATITEISKSAYYFDEPYANREQEGSTPPSNTGVYWAIVSKPKKGIYQIDLSGKTGHSYSLTVYGTNRDSKTTFKLLEGVLSSYGTETYKVQYYPDTTESIVVNKETTFKIINEKLARKKIWYLLS